jgi:hypothetical protein
MGRKSMKPNELFKAKNQDLISSAASMHRAAALARQVAIQTGTAIVFVKDEKIIRCTTAELLAQVSESVPQFGK